ncbi:hypothetical protein N7530_012816 [Penicillium desertorum]|uniref:Uncharacterized protein n=1 Tax=Penicillium desertorum TaxID=1303715 RepID=A0A9X0BFF0_9EURO|nr:hypothetical protein N7530_012816 [Penicillium desertorum]
MEGAHEAPGYGGTPGVPGGTLKPGSDQAPVKALAGCGMWPSDEGSRPRGQRRRTADPAGRLPPGIWVSGMASGHRSTDSNGAGRQKAPGFGHHSGGTREELGESPPITTRPGTEWPPRGPKALRGEEVMGGSGVAGSRMTPLRWVNPPPGTEERHKAATIRTGERISLAGKMRRRVVLVSTQTHRPHLGCKNPKCSRSG